MHDAGDMELLREYDRQGSEAAFAALGQRHVNLVYSAAHRHVGIDAHAEEITQAVFIILARKAAGLRADTILEGWLYETTRLTALSFLRGERRRQFREQEAYMQSTLQQSADEPTWNRLAPLLDEAMARLGKKDRDAVVLRFFKDKNLRKVAAAMRVNEATAQRRVHRAVEKLRKFFTKRGIMLPAAVLTAAISANSVQAAPVELAKTVTAVAIAKGAVASGSTLTIIKGVLKAMVWAKAKNGIIIGASVLLVAVIATITIRENQKPSHIAYEYEADGTFDGEQHFLFGDIKKWDPVSFRIYVRDNQWLIHATQPNSHMKYWEVGFDGKTMYYSGMLDEKAVADVNPKPNLWGGDISFESVPFNGTEPHIPIIWLALASSHYLDEAKDHLLPPYSTELVRVRFPASVIRLDNPPRLPQSITFFDDGFDRREGVPKQRPPPFDKGFNNAIYTVNTFTNIGGYSLPLTFNLKVFVPDYSAGSGITLTEEFDGTISDVSAECSLTNFIPEVAGVGLIGDTRFVSADAIRKTRFNYRTNRWLSTNEAEALPGFSNYVFMERMMKNNSPILVTHGKLPQENLSPLQRQQLDDLRKFAAQGRRKQIIMIQAEKRRRNLIVYALILSLGLASVFVFLRYRRK
jgi:RNA polymerase sigma factor (sigma-70 family)